MPIPSLFEALTRRRQQEAPGADRGYGEDRDNCQPRAGGVPDAERRTRFPASTRNERAAGRGTAASRIRARPHRLWAAVLALLLAGAAEPARAKSLSIVAFGDSLVAGPGLTTEQTFPSVLEKALRKDGFDVSVANAGVSGDTTAGGLDRLDWSVPDGTDGVILELGANDMLRGMDPAIPRRNLHLMMGKLKDRHIGVFLAGMLANPTLGTDYKAKFDAIYPELAKSRDVPLYPFFLDGVMGHERLQLRDGLHPNAAGVQVLVKNILPSIEDWLKTFQP